MGNQKKRSRSKNSRNHYGKNKPTREMKFENTVAEFKPDAVTPTIHSEENDKIKTETKNSLGHNDIMSIPTNEDTPSLTVADEIVVDEAEREHGVQNKTTSGRNEKLHSKTTCFRCGLVRDFLDHCSCCKRATYCGKECQRKHYKSHKGICELLANFNAAKQKIPQTVLQYQGQAVDVSFLLNDLQNSMIYDVIGTSNFVLVEILEYIPWNKTTNMDIVTIRDAANQTAKLHFEIQGKDSWWLLGNKNFISSLRRGNFLLLKHGSWDWVMFWAHNSMSIRDLTQMEVIMMNK